jgi:Integrase core domain
MVEVVKFHGDFNNPDDMVVTESHYMDRIIKDATVKRYFYETHDQLRTHLADFVTAYNFARRLKTLKGLTPYEYICKLWTKEPERFTLNPLEQMPGLNI